MPENYLLNMQHISKAFPGVQALDDVALEVKNKEILTIVGENGAGKSTLVRILSGAIQADSGQILLDGELMNCSNPKEAMQSGIRIINQELSYLDEMSIAENVFLGNWPMTKYGRVDYKKLKRNCIEVLSKVNLNVDPFDEAKTLSVAQKQLVEIAKAISDDFKILVMDEPTAALNEKEIENLFELIRNIIISGKSIIYISHKMDEVFTISDRIQVMRDGKRISVNKRNETSREQVVADMVGRNINDMYPKNYVGRGKVLLEVEGLSNDVFSDVSFKVHSGELLGIFGLMGSGRTNIVEAIFGVRKVTSGKVKIDGKTVKIDSPKKAMGYGIAYLPNERKKDGLILDHSVQENIILANIDKRIGTLKLNLRKEGKLADQWINKLRIKVPNRKTEVGSLSGGNQQKVVIAKALETKPKILILNEPTRGIDVGAKVEIYKLMEELCEQGLAVIMISSELPEIISISDRVAVVCEGRIAGELSRDEIGSENIMKLAIGGI